MIFAGWRGDFNSNELASNLVVDSPKELIVNWKRQYLTKISFRGLPNGSRAGLWVNEGEIWTQVPRLIDNGPTSLDNPQG